MIKHPIAVCISSLKPYVVPVCIEYRCLSKHVHTILNIIKHPMDHPQCYGQKMLKSISDGQSPQC